MDRAPALCIVGDLGVIRNAFSASLSRSTNGLVRTARGDRFRSKGCKDAHYPHTCAARNAGIYRGIG